MPLSFQPACLPVAQGSLPHSSPVQALGLLLKTTPALLAWPQLPRRNFREQDYVQSVIAFPGLILDERAEYAYVDRSIAKRELDHLSLAYLQDKSSFGALTAEDAPGLTELRRILSMGQGFTGRALKSQIMGPISAGLQLTDEQRRPLAYDPMLIEALVHHLTLRIAWQSAQLADLATDVIICLNEPFLDAFASPFCPLDWDVGVELLEWVFSGIRGCRGLATSGPVNWTALLQTSVELIHFDAYNYGTLLLEAAELFAGFLERAGIITWGLIPSDEGVLAHETTPTLLARFDALLARLVAAGLSREKVLQASLISTSGGLAQVSVAGAERAMQLCAEVSAELRRTYGLESVPRK